jgi:putative hydrolase of the HAD superfamily
MKPSETLPVLPARPVAALLCDVDGVLRLWDDTMERLDHAHGIPPGTLAGAAFAPERLLPAITGRVTDERWRQGVLDELSTRLRSAGRARALVTAWSAETGRVDGRVRTLLTAARSRMRVVLVSNATTRLESDLARLGVGDLADAVVNTARLGAAKPDPAVYRHAAAVAGVDPGHCLFVDDSERNVVTARELGMTGVHYTAPGQLRRALAA